jgi:hypothetical protein
MSTYETFWVATDNKQHEEDVIHRLGGNDDPAVSSMWGNSVARDAALEAWKGAEWVSGEDPMDGSASKALADAITAAADSVTALANANTEVTRVTAIQTGYET